MRRHASELTDPKRIDALKKARDACGNSKVLARRMHACRSRQLRALWGGFLILNLFLIVVFCLRHRQDLVSVIFPWFGFAYLILSAICVPTFIKNHYAEERFYAERMVQNQRQDEWECIAFDAQDESLETSYKALSQVAARVGDPATIKKFSSEERRWVIRFGLQYYNLPCSTCHKYVQDLGPTDCPACGNG